MLEKLEEKKKRLNEQIEKNLARKKLLIAKEKKKRATKFNMIGRLAYQADIDQLDERILLGAFLEIADTASEEKKNQWKKTAENFLHLSSKNVEQIFSISFLEEPNQEIKRKLKEKKFSWNRFRKEYYGRGEKSEIENLLKDCKIRIEEIAY